MKPTFIPHLSVDCVLFGFDDKQLKVLVQRRDKVEGEDSKLPSGMLKLPGRLIYEEEYLKDAAISIVGELVEDSNIPLKQFQVYGNPNRIKSPNDLLWLQKQTNLPITRVVTISFYALIKIDESKSNLLDKHRAEWVSIKDAVGLAFDHDVIVCDAYDHLKKELTTTPLEFHLLPQYFPLNSLQSLYEVILAQKFDNRNFRKKILKLPYLIESDKKEQDVTHRPAKLYQFNEDIYKNNKRELNLFFL